MKNRGNKIRTRERTRAHLIHELFIAMEPRLKDASIAELHAEMRRRYIRRWFGFSIATCYRLFARWRVNPSPETLLHKYKGGIRQVSKETVERVGRVVAVALKQRISLYEAHKLVSTGVSYPTVLRRASLKPELKGLIRIEQARRRLAKAEKRLVARTGGMGA